MARKRMVDPSIWESSTYVALPNWAARLFFIGLISHADDEGRMRGFPATLRGRIFYLGPEIYDEDIEAWIKLLHDHGTIISYAVDGVRYIQICKWTQYQTLNHPTPSKLPPPPQEIADKQDDGTWSRRDYAVDDDAQEDNIGSDSRSDYGSDSRSDYGSDSLTKERKGREGKGIENYTCPERLSAARGPAADEEDEEPPTADGFAAIGEVVAARVDPVPLKRPPRFPPDIWPLIERARTDGEDMPKMWLPVKGDSPNDWPGYPVTSELAAHYERTMSISRPMIRRLCQSMRSWLEANPQKRKTFGGMPRFMVSWILREIAKEE